MVIVAEEVPFVAVVDDDKLNTVCSNCFAVKGEVNKIDLKTCDNCRVINYCSKKCQEEDWKFHEDECQFLSKSGNFPSKIRMMSRFILRVKRGDLPVAFNGRTYDDLMDHKDEIEKDVGRYDQMKVAYRSLVQFMGPENAPPFEEFTSFHGKSVINSFGIGFVGILHQYMLLGSGLYLGFAVHNHSCRPTAIYHFNGSKIVLCAHDPNVKYSKDLTVPYIPNTTTRNYRQRKLRSNYYFDCNCERCMDEETELLERSGRSPCCPTEGAVLPVDKKFQFLGYWRQPLVCTNCGKKVETTFEQINEYNETVAELCSLEDKLLEDVRFQADVDELIKLLDRAELFLSPYNLKLVEFTALVTRAAAIVDWSSPLYGKSFSAEEKVLEKYSLFIVMGRILMTLHVLRKECGESCNYPRKIAFAKFEASCQKALDVVKEAYGPEHSLCKEIEQFSECIKLNYDIHVGPNGKDHDPLGTKITKLDGLNKFLYDKITNKKKRKTEEKNTAKEGDY